jgi:hypothetical protein
MSDNKLDPHNEQDHPHGLKEWLLEEHAEEPEGAFETEAEVSRENHHTQSWWKVMCLTGVDYFSTLGYQPGIAALAAGALSPIATLILVLVTLFGALPVYRRIAAESPHGQGSLSMLERLLDWWQGKLFILVLLGFAATDFIITITLSAADAAAHIVENPLVHQFAQGQNVLITLVLILLLGAVFLKGFGEAVGIAVVLVIAYLGLNVIVVGRGLLEMVTHPQYFPDWTSTLFTQHPNPLALIGVSLLLFPKLALGLSGFETGVAVMSLVKGNKTDMPQNPLGRIKNTQNLLATAALIMSVFLIASSLATTTLISHDKFLPEVSASTVINPKLLETGTASIELDPDKEGELPKTLYALPSVKLELDKPTQLMMTSSAGQLEVMATAKQQGTDLMLEVVKEKGVANGRALAYLAHNYFGDIFGTIYDISTILILWFAGASAMAALINLVPRYLPRYGMAPDWARANRPLVLIFTAISVIVTLVFKADVDAQGGAYATGVLVLISSAAFAVTLSARAAKQRGLTIMFSLITLVFVYTTITNVIERPDGIRIAAIFILGIIVISLISRTFRTFELRISSVKLDAAAQKIIDQLALGEIRIIANRRQRGDEAEYQDKELRQREDHHIESQEKIAFFEVEISDPSDFSGEIEIYGFELEGLNGAKYQILRTEAPAVPNAIAAFMLHLRDTTGFVPHCYFTWSDGNPIRHLIRYVLFGEGDTAPITHEILRVAEENAQKRPSIHVGG